MLKKKNAIISSVVIIILCAIYYFSRSEMIYTGVNGNPSFIEVLKFIFHGLF